MLQMIPLKRSSLKGGQGCGGRNSEMVTELQLCFACSQMNREEWVKRALLIHVAEIQGIKTHIKLLLYQ